MPNTDRTSITQRTRAFLIATSLVLFPACGGIYLYDDVTPLDEDGDGLIERDERRYGTSIYDPDTDGDGLFDGEEVFDYSSDPLRYDSDEDGLSDGEEVFEFFTDPLHYDSDGDGFADGREVRLGRDPLRYD